MADIAQSNQRRRPWTRTPHRSSLRSQGCLPILGRSRTRTAQAWECRSCSVHLPREPQRVGRAETHPDAPATRQATRKPGKPAELPFGATGPEKTPATFRAPFLCAIRSRLPVCMPVNPDASTHTIRVSLRLRQCAAIAVCRLPPSKTPASSAQPAIAASDALTQPQEGHAQANAAGVRRSAVVAADVVAGFGSGLPGMEDSQPLLSRHRRNVVPKVAPKRPPVNSPQVSAADGGNSRPIALLGGPEPPARLFLF
jgi:hypothetical protein